MVGPTGTSIGAGSSRADITDVTHGTPPVGFTGIPSIRARRKHREKTNAMHSLSHARLETGWRLLATARVDMNAGRDCKCPHRVWYSPQVRLLGLRSRSQPLFHLIGRY